MSVSVIINSIPIPADHDAVQRAVLKGIGETPGDWRVYISERQTPEYFITIMGSDGFKWERRFFGIEEQNPSDDFDFIRKTVAANFQEVR
jgi:hypothetical protein